MAPITKFVLTALCVVAVNPVLSAPISGLRLRQLHGEGVACDAVFTDTDNGVGYGTENAENNAAALITSTKAPPALRRQLHGEGVACDAILTDTDNGVGYGTENAENNAAQLITSTQAHPPAHKRQLDKIANGFGNVANAAGIPGVGNDVVQNGDTVDGQLTDDAANDGTAIAGMEETTLEQAGSDVPTHV